MKSCALVSSLIKQNISEIQGQIQFGIWFFIIIQHNACRAGARIVNQCGKSLKVVAGEKIIAFESRKVLIGKFFLYRHKAVRFQPEMQGLIEIQDCFYSAGKEIICMEIFNEQ